MNRSYVDAFNILAKECGPSLIGDAVICRPIDREHRVDLEKVLLIARKHVKSLGLTPKELTGRCFFVIYEISKVLIAERIIHTVTIGNVLINGKEYFSATKASIEKDFIDGYRDDKPADAHAWITLGDGTIIDLTIKSSVCEKLKKKPLKMIDAIFSRRPGEVAEIQHLPIALGPKYIIAVTTPPNLSARTTSYEWVIGLHELLGKEPEAI